MNIVLHFYLKHLKIIEWADFIICLRNLEVRANQIGTSNSQCRVCHKNQMFSVGTLTETFISFRHRLYSSKNQAKDLTKRVAELQGRLLSFNRCSVIKSKTLKKSRNTVMGKWWDPHSWNVDNWVNKSSNLETFEYFMPEEADPFLLFKDNSFITVWRPYTNQTWVWCLTTDTFPPKELPYHFPFLKKIVYLLKTLQNLLNWTHWNQMRRVDLEGVKSRQQWKYVVVWILINIEKSLLTWRHWPMIWGAILHQGYPETVLMHYWDGCFKTGYNDHRKLGGDGKYSWQNVDYRNIREADMLELIYHMGQENLPHDYFLHEGREMASWRPQRMYL